MHSVALLLAQLFLACVYAENMTCTTDYCLNEEAEGAKPVPLTLSLDVGFLPDGWQTVTEQRRGENLTMTAGRGPLSKYPVLSKQHFACMFSHDLAAFCMLFCIIFQFNLSKHGSTWHKRIGRCLVYIFMPFSIIPALYIALYLRPTFAEHHNNNFPTPFLRRIIGLYGFSFIATCLHIVVFSWNQHPPERVSEQATYTHLWTRTRRVYFARGVALLNLMNSFWWCEMTRFIHTELWTKNYSHDSKVFKLSVEMAIITSAFLLWEPVNFFILVKHGVFSSKAGHFRPLEHTKQTYRYGPSTMLTLHGSFVQKRHHVLNVHFVSVLAAFAPMLFLFHDTYYIWTEANGFGPDGLHVGWRTFLICICTVFPMFLLPQLISFCKAVAKLYCKGGHPCWGQPGGNPVMKMQYGYLAHIESARECNINSSHSPEDSHSDVAGASQTHTNAFYNHQTQDAASVELAPHIPERTAI